MCQGSKCKQRMQGRVRTGEGGMKGYGACRYSLCRACGSTVRTQHHGMFARLRTLWAAAMCLILTARLQFDAAESTDTLTIPRSNLRCLYKNISELFMDYSSVNIEVQGRASMYQCIYLRAPLPLACTGHTPILPAALPSSDCVCRSRMLAREARSCGETSRHDNRLRDDPQDSRYPLVKHWRGPAGRAVACAGTW